MAEVAQNFGLVAGGVWASFFLLLGIIIRQVGPWRKQSIDAAQKFRDELLTRIEKLERELAEALQREQASRLRHEAERALDRHRLNNVTQCFDAMILLLEATPEKASEIVRRIKEMRAEQLKAEALEKAAIHAAAMDEARRVIL